jgi:hypothetical protein
MKQPPLQPQDVQRFVEEIAGHALHAKQVESLAHAIVGAMHADTASIAAIGRAAARQREVTEKHSIKQVDRLLSNGKLNVAEVQRCIVSALVGGRPEIVVALDWTEFAPDGHSTLAISMISDHGRVTPLVWRSIPTKKLNGRRSKLEQSLVRQLRSTVPLATKVTILADRGFGNTALFQLIEGLGFQYVVRIRDCIWVESSDGTGFAAEARVPGNGRARRLDDARVTRRRVTVPGVVFVKSAGMQEPWCLATNRADSADAIVSLYARRFDIEHTFRDQKDRRFGFGLYYCTVGTPERRDRLLLVLTFAAILTTLLGAAGEKMQLDKQLRANTAKKRTHSLFRQGREYAAGVARSVVHEMRALFRNLWKAHRATDRIYASL